MQTDAALGFKKKNALYTNSAFLPPIVSVAMYEDLKSQEPHTVSWSSYVDALFHVGFWVSTPRPGAGAVLLTSRLVGSSSPSSWN